MVGQFVAQIHEEHFVVLFGLYICLHVAIIYCRMVHFVFLGELLERPARS